MPQGAAAVSEYMENRARSCVGVGGRCSPTTQIPLLSLSVGTSRDHLPLLAGWLLDLAAIFEPRTLHVPYTQVPLNSIPFSTYRHAVDHWIDHIQPSLVASSSSSWSSLA